MPAHPEITWSVTKPHANSEPWAELVLAHEREGNTRHTIDLTREGGERLIEALHEHLHPWAGRSIQEQIWQHLDAATDRLLNGGAAEDDKGFARGLAMACAIFRNPYSPNIESIRAEAMARQGHERSVLSSKDPQLIWLREQGMVQLQTLASEVRIKGYQKLDKGRLINTLDEYDLDAWRLPAQQATEEPPAEGWDLTED